MSTEVDSSSSKVIATTLGREGGRKGRPLDRGGELELGSVVFIQHASVMRSHPSILSVATMRARPPIMIGSRGFMITMECAAAGQRGLGCRKM